jgi:uncharacterized protein (DUF983 family)
MWCSKIKKYKHSTLYCTMCGYEFNYYQNNKMDCSCVLVIIIIIMILIFLYGKIKSNNS